MIVKKDYSHLAEKIREIREANHLTREKMGWRLGTGKISVSIWEEGLAAPSPNQCSIIADMGGISIEELFGLTENGDNDMVDHPKHYTSGNIEVWDFIIDQDLNYCRGSAVKYISRAGKKDDAIQDLNKAINFLKREIKRLETGK